MGQLGGTKRFQDFIDTYPRLRDPPRTAVALATRYSSRAAAHYRSYLDTLCDHDQRGGTTDVDLPQPPSPDEGHLQIVGGAGHAGNIGNSGETKQRSNSDEDDDPDAEVRSLEEELATLEEAYLVQ